MSIMLPAVRAFERWRALPIHSNIVRLLGSVFILCVLAFFVDVRAVGATLSGIGIMSLVVCVGLLIFSQYLSSVRLYSLLRDHGVEAPYVDVARANIYGIVGGMLFFNVFGQGVTRTVLLRRYRVPQSTIFFLTLLERAIALLVLLMAALVGAAILFRHVPLPAGYGGALLLQYTVVAALVVAGVAGFGLTRRQRRHLRLFCATFASIATLRLIALTLLMHTASLACYVLIAINIAPVAHVGETAAASAIVMLVASLPISFAGWGFRELSASLAYAQIGFSSEQGLAVGVIIGLMSIVALACNAAWIGLRAHTSAPAPCSTQAASVRGSVTTARLEYPIYWLFSLATAVAVLFQIRIPTRSGELNVNLGDPLAIMTALLVFGLVWQVRRTSQFWRAPGLLPAFGLLTVVLASALAHTYAVYGPVDWAIFNRFIGWLILLAYFLSGGLIVIVSGRTGMAALSRVLIAGAVTLVIWELGHRFLAANFNVEIGELPFRAEAVAGNPNAFAFQLLMAFGVLIAGTNFRAHNGPTQLRTLGGLLLAGLWLAGSRAAGGALAAVIIAIPALLPSITNRHMYMRRLTEAAAIGAVALIVPDLLTALIRHTAAFTNLSSGFAVDSANVQADRIESLRGGLAMWAAHPLFGAGLGAYIHEHIAATGVPLVIHSSPLWVAAEMGVVGLCAFGLLFGTIGNALRKERLWAGQDSRALAGVCIVIIAVMSLAHDMIYQRLWWLILGAAMASPLSARMLLKRAL